MRPPVSPLYILQSGPLRCYRQSSRRIRSTGIRFPRLERRPRPRIHIAQNWRHPSVVRMLADKFCSVEIRSARMSHPREEAHVFRHAAVRYFSLDCARWLIGSRPKIRIVPCVNISVPAQCPAAGFRLLRIRIHVVGDERFCERCVDVPLARFYQLFPTHAPGVW